MYFACLLGLAFPPALVLSTRSRVGAPEPTKLRCAGTNTARLRDTGLASRDPTTP